MNSTSDSRSATATDNGPRRGLRRRLERSEQRALPAIALVAVVALLLVGLRPGAAFGDAEATRAAVDVPLQVVADAVTEGQVDVVVQLASTDQAPGGQSTAPASQDPPSTVERRGRQLLADVKEPAGSGDVMANLGVVRLTATPTQLDQLAHSKLVKAIEADELLAPALDRSTAWIGAPTAWESGYKGTGKVVAVIDSGVDLNHPALRGKVVAQACFTNASCPNGDSVQKDGNAAILCSLGSACEHGTHVAGIVAGNDPANPSLRGVAPGASIMAVQVFSRSDNPADCGLAGAPCPRARTSDVLAALEHVYAERNKWDIVAVNMSLSSDTAAVACNTSILAGAVDKLKSANIATIVASGNAGYQTGLGVPACITNTISVGATYSNADVVWPLSNISGELDLLAPGVAINSPAPGGGYSPTTGTSAAAPHVAGAWALVSEKLGTRNVDTIRNYLRSTGVAVGVPNTSFVIPRIALAGLGDGGLPVAKGGLFARWDAPKQDCQCSSVTGDFNGDGMDDILWYGVGPDGTGTELWTTVGNGGVFSGAVSAPMPARGYRPIVGEFTADGRDDVLWYGNGGTNWLYASVGNSQFSGSMAPPMLGGYVPVAGDFDGNGISDIFWYGPGTLASWVFLGQGNGAFAGISAFPIGGAYVPLVGDYDGDGKSDIYWYGKGDTVDWMWQATTGGAFTGAQLDQMAAASDFMPTVGDYNGDRRSDILWYAPGPSMDWLWTAAGKMLFSSTDYEVSGSLRLLPFSGDFDGNRRTDVFWYGPGTQPESLWMAGR